MLSVLGVVQKWCTYVNEMKIILNRYDLYCRIIAKINGKDNNADSHG